MATAPFFKTPRSIESHGVFEDPFVFKVYIWGRMKARHEPYFSPEGGLIDRDQFTTGRFAASQKLNAPVGKIRGAFAKLERMGLFTIKSTNRFSIITVHEIDGSSLEDDGDSPAINQPLTNRAPTASQQLTTSRDEETKRRRDVETGGDIAADGFSLEPPKAKPKRGSKPKDEFVPPTESEVAAYIQERIAEGKPCFVDAEQFVAHYTNTDWTQKGGTKIKSWKAAVVLWEKNELKWGADRGGNRGARLAAATVDSGIKSVDDLEWIFPELDKPNCRAALQRWIDHLWDRFRFRYRSDLELLSFLKPHALNHGDWFAHNVDFNIGGARREFWTDRNFRPPQMWVFDADDAMENFDRQKENRLRPYIDPKCPARIKDYLNGKSAAKTG